MTTIENPGAMTAHLRYHNPSETRIRPRNDQVLVELEPLPSTTAGGLHIPDAALYRHESRPDGRWGKVLAVGPGKLSKRGELVPVGVDVGARVMINAWMNDSIKTGVYAQREDDRVVLVAAGDILLVDEGEATG